LAGLGNFSLYEAAAKMTNDLFYLMIKRSLTIQALLDPVTRTFEQGLFPAVGSNDPSSRLVEARPITACPSASVPMHPSASWR
jgi:hypothetical protein